MTLYDVFVPGDPKGQPRPRAFAFHGKARVYDPGTAEHWKSQIALAFPLAIQTYSGPVTVLLHFAFKRPKGHLRRDGSVKPTAETYHTGKPDCDNAAKAVLDALTTLGAWGDDAQVARLVVGKTYANPPALSGCAITISTLETNR